MDIIWENLWKSWHIEVVNKVNVAPWRQKWINFGGSFMTGWWFGTMELYDFPYRKNNPNWRTHIFQRDWNHQPVWIWQWKISINAGFFMGKSLMPDFPLLCLIGGKWTSVSTHTKRPFPGKMCDPSRDGLDLLRLNFQPMSELLSVSVLSSFP